MRNDDRLEESFRRAFASLQTRVPALEGLGLIGFGLFGPVVLKWALPLVPPGNK